MNENDFQQQYLNHLSHYNYFIHSITNDQLRQLLQKMSEIKGYYSINFSKEQPIDVEAVELLASFIKECDQLESLEINLPTSNAGIQSFSEALIKSNNLKKIELTCCWDVAFKLRAAFANSNAFANTKLSDVADDVLYLILSHLKNNPHLNKLNISNDFLTAYNSSSLAFKELLQNHENLAELRIENMFLNKPATSSFIEGLANNLHLKKITFDSCTFNRDKSADLFSAIFHGEKKEIRLHDVPIPDEAVILIAKQLRNNNSLKSLILYNCNIKDDTGAVLLASLSQNANLKLKELSLGKNSLALLSAEEMNKLIRANQTIRRLAIFNNPFIENIELIITSLNDNSTLSEFYFMDSDQFTEELLDRLINTLKTNWSLTDVGSIKNNHDLNQTKVNTICNAFKRNREIAYRISSHHNDPVSMLNNLENSISSVGKHNFSAPSLLHLGLSYVSKHSKQFPLEKLPDDLLFQLLTEKNAKKHRFFLFADKKEVTKETNQPVFEWQIGLKS